MSGVEEGRETSHSAARERHPSLFDREASDRHRSGVTRRAGVEKILVRYRGILDGTGVSSPVSRKAPDCPRWSVQGNNVSSILLSLRFGAGVQNKESMVSTRIVCYPGPPAVSVPRFDIEEKFMFSFTTRFFASSALLFTLLAACGSLGACSSTPGGAAADAAVDGPPSSADSSVTVDGAASADGATNSSDAAIPVQCKQNAGEPSCLGCLKEKCCAKLAECLTTECKTYSECVNTCGDDAAACDQDCKVKYPGGAKTESELRACGETSCAAACN